MSQTLNLARIRQLRSDAYQNIESYNDPDTPHALADFTAQMKSLLLAEPELLETLPEYLPVALYGRVKFSSAGHKLWAQWLKLERAPSWDEFKTTIAFNNADLPLVKTVKAFDLSLLIEACAVLFLLAQDAASDQSEPARRAARGEDDEGYDSDNEDPDHDPYGMDDADPYAEQEDNDEDYDDPLEDIRFSGER